MFSQCNMGRPYCHKLGTNPDSVAVTEKFLMEKPNNTLSDPGIEPRTSCLAVGIAITKPTRQCYWGFTFMSPAVPDRVRCIDILIVSVIAGIEELRINIVT